MVVSALISEAILLIAAAHALLIGAAAGAPLWRGLKPEAGNAALRGALALALGLALQITALFALGAVGLLSASFAIGVGALFAGFALAVLYSSGALQWPPDATRADLAVALGLYVMVAAEAIKAPGFQDDTMYHLPLARFYAETQALGLYEWARFPLFPQNMELLFALAFSLRPGDVLLAEGFAALPAFGVALGLVGAGLWLRGSRVVGVAAAIVFLGLPVVDKTLGYAYIDVGLAFFCFAAEIGALALRARAGVGAGVALGIVAGAAAGCKIHGLIAAALVFAALAALRFNSRALIAFAAACALFGCGWYVRSYLISGDPISPAGGAWFGYFLWDAGDLLSQKQEQARHGVGTALYQIPRALIKAGANMLVIAPLAPLFARRERATTFALWAIFLAYVMFWFFSSQVDRYLAPVHAIGALLTALVVCDLLSLVARRVAPRTFSPRPALVGAVIAALVIGFGVRAFSRAIYEARNWDAILAGRPGYQALQKANTVKDRYGDRLVQIGFEGSAYFFSGVAIGDWFGPGRYDNFVVPKTLRLIPADSMRVALARFDAKLLVVNKVFSGFDVEDYARDFDTLFDDGRQTLLALKPQP